MPTLTLKVSDTLFDRVKGAVGSGNQSEWLREAIETKLMGVTLERPPIEFTKSEQRQIAAGGKTIAELVDASIRDALTKRTDLLGALSPQDLAKLAVSRLPKMSDDSDEENEVVNLLECIRKLPGIEDITNEVSKAKGEIKKLEFEIDLWKNRYIALKKVARKEVPELLESLDRFILAVKDGVVLWVTDQLSRGSYPGYGDEGGVREDEYFRTASEIRKAIDDAWCR